MALKYTVVSFTYLVVSAAGLAAPVDQTTLELEKVFRNAMVAPGIPPAIPFMRRPVFAKSHGCLKARFVVNPKLAKKYRIGPFSHDTLPAWIRFSNDSNYTKDTPDKTLGMAVKVVGVEGPMLLDGEEEAVTQDFLMQNHPVFFSNNSEDFLAFINARTPKQKETFDKEHPETARVFAEMDKRVLADPMDGQYWTPVPFRLGKDEIKYMAKPCVAPIDSDKKPMVAEHFRRENLNTTLKKLWNGGQDSKEGCFNFYVQIRDKATMSLEAASVKWSEDKAEFKLFATLHISADPKINDINHPDRILECEALSMTGWHTSNVMEPLGSLNVSRRHVYKAMADVRRKVNGFVSVEPKELDLNKL